MKFRVLSLTTIILLSNLLPSTISDLSFEIRSDIEIAIETSLRPSPVRTIQITRAAAEQYCNNFKNIVASLRSRPMTVLAMINLRNLDARTTTVCVASQNFFNRDKMTVWYNRVRRILEQNFVFTKMKNIIDGFMKRLNWKKTPRCWNRFRAPVQNVTKYYVVSVAYIRMESFLRNKFNDYRNESIAFVQSSRNVGPGSSPTSFLSNNYDKMMDLHKRWMDDLTQLDPNVNQSTILMKIFDETFNVTLPRFEEVLKTASDCTVAKLN